MAAIVGHPGSSVSEVIDMFPFGKIRVEGPSRLVYHVLSIGSSPPPSPVNRVSSILFRPHHLLLFFSCLSTPCCIMCSGDLFVTRPSDQKSTSAITSEGCLKVRQVGSFDPLSISTEEKEPHAHVAVCKCNYRGALCFHDFVRARVWTNEKGRC